jgi:predicted permease
VLDATDLPPSVRADVEADLRAHFEDGLAAGRDPRELVESFGDPVEAGRRIDEARRPGGPAGGLAGGAAVGRTESGRWGMTGHELWTEARRAVRSLVRTPGFTAVVVATLALGVGANTAVFTVLDAALLAPLPYDDPGELVRVYETADWEGADGSFNYLRAPAVLRYEAWDEVFQSFGVLYTYRETGGDLTDGDAPERVVVSYADDALFETLGVEPILGRTFLPEEVLGSSEEIGRGPASPVAVISHDLWQRRFAGDPDVVGRTLRLDGAALQVVGVMPAGFTNPFGTPPDLWVPQDLREGGRNEWGNHYLSGVARLRDGLTLAEARSRVDARVAALIEARPEAEGWGMGLVPLRADVVGSSRTTMLWVLAGAVALVLLSACVNVGNLVFARSLGREKDLAVRSALGSGRGRLVVHLLVESGMLAVAGGAVGVLVGWLGVRLLPALAPDALPPLVVPELGGRVFVAALVATTLSLVLFGLAPALRLSGASPADILRGGSRGGTDDRRVRTVRDGLVVAQVGVAVVLVVGAGLLLRSFAKLRSVDLAIEPEGVLTFEVHLPDARYASGADRAAFHERLEAGVASLPGVVAAGATSWLPVNGRYHTWSFAIDPDRLEDDDGWYGADVRVVAGDYFGALGIEVLRGADLTSLDPEGPDVVWVNRTLVEEVFGGRDVIGRTIQVGGEPRRIVGIVEDVPHDPRGSVARETYIPHAQFADNRNWALIQTVRASRGADLAALRSRIEEALRAIDGQLVLYRARPFDDLLASVRAQDRFATALMGVFAALALTLSAVGTYGVLANAVARRRREIGIRMALGADAGRVRGMVVGSAAAMTVAGTVLGLGVAWMGGRWLEALLFRVEPGDPLVLAAGAGVLLAFGALAAWVPAQRATRVDPARTLASE